jgi:hypothetical protein
VRFADEHRSVLVRTSHAPRRTASRLKNAHSGVQDRASSRAIALAPRAPIISTRKF